MSSVFDALADPIRRDLLAELSAGSRRVVDLAAGHDVTRPAISRHLRILSDAGLVAATEQGRERHYRLVVEPLGEVTDFVTRLRRGGPPVTGQHLDALATEVRRTAREHRRSSTTEPITQEDIA